MTAGETAPCFGCGLVVPDGTAGCQRILDELLARDFSDAAYFRVTGPCWLLEHGGDRAIGSEALRRWLDGAPRIERPAIPSFRGVLTVEDVHGVAADPVAYEGAVDRWARSTWEAYAPLHARAGAWIRQATAVSRRPRATGR